MKEYIRLACTLCVPDQTRNGQEGNFYFTYFVRVNYPLFTANDEISPKEKTYVVQQLREGAARRSATTQTDEDLFQDACSQQYPQVVNYINNYRGRANIEESFLTPLGQEIAQVISQAA